MDELNNNLEEKFLSLTNDEEIYEAGLNWDISTEAKNKMFLQLKEDLYIYKAFNNWINLRKDYIEKKFMEVKDFNFILKFIQDFRISHNIKYKKFLELEDNLSIKIYRHWDKIPIYILEKKFMALTNEEALFWAGREWRLSNFIKNYKFLLLWSDIYKKFVCSENCIYLYGLTWNGLSNKNKNIIFLKMKDKEAINNALLYWTGLTNKSKELQRKYLENK